jgi:hypothetical protein
MEKELKQIRARQRDLHKMLSSTGVIDRDVFLLVEEAYPTGIDLSSILNKMGMEHHEDRVIDRSLQRLRKSGKIEHQSKLGWILGRSYQP